MNTHYATFKVPCPQCMAKAQEPCKRHDGAGDPYDPKQYAHKARHTAYSLHLAAKAAKPEEPKRCHAKRTAKDAPNHLVGAQRVFWADGWNDALAAQIKELNLAFREEQGH